MTLFAKYQFKLITKWNYEFRKILWLVARLEMNLYRYCILQSNTMTIQTHFWRDKNVIWYELALQSGEMLTL